VSHKNSAQWLDHPRTAVTHEPHAAVQIINRATWMQSAACHPTGLPDAWFSNPHPNDLDTRAALRVCRGCSVRKDCLEYALAAEDPPRGVWGGTTEMARKALAAKRSAS